VPLQFADFTIDADSRLLRQGGTPVHLSRKAFDLLRVLLDRRPGTVTKDELHQHLWPGTFVVDANLSVTVAEVRRALGDDPQAPRFIRTVHRVGYAFCGEARDVAPAVAPGTRAWLVLDGRPLTLSDGAHLLGRDPSCAVWLDASGVSRRHARLQLTERGAVLEDLGSTNGTRVNGAPIGGPCRLHDGDRLQLGPVQLEFRTASEATSAETVRLGER
jgi:DNA-binding winged helix-turn-helix (wHTH) protein